MYEKPKFKAFNFSKFPLLEQAHKKYQKIHDRMYALDVKKERSFGKLGYDRVTKLLEIATAELNEYSLDVYAKIIFNEFSKIKPKIQNIHRKIWKYREIENDYIVIGEKNEFDEWDEVFPVDFEQLTTEKKNKLVHLVENGSSSCFPMSYYNSRDKNEIEHEEVYRIAFEKNARKILSKNNMDSNKKISAEEFEKQVESYVENNFAEHYKTVLSWSKKK